MPRYIYQLLLHVCIVFLSRCLRDIIDTVNYVVEIHGPDNYTLDYECVFLYDMTREFVDD